jgi:hypothetical protein
MTPFTPQLCYAPHITFSFKCLTFDIATKYTLSLPTDRIVAFAVSVYYTVNTIIINSGNLLHVSVLALVDC